MTGPVAAALAGRAKETSGATRRRVDAALRAFAADGGVEVTVNGGSMEPRLVAGDRVRVRRARVLLPGDVVVLRHREGLVIHRLLGGGLRRAGWRLLTQGDARPRPDGWSAPENVVGVADLPCPLPLRLRSLCRFAGAVVRGIGRRLRR